MSDWKEFSLGDVADPNDRYSFSGGPFGSNLKSEEYTESGVRIIQLQNIGDGIFRDDYKIYTSEEKADELSSCNIYPGEIILSKMGDPVARAALIPDMDERYLMASDGIRLKVDQTRFDPTFVLSAINSPQFRGNAESVSVGSTRKRIGLTTLKGLTISAPPLPEQKKIAEILSGVDKEITGVSRFIQRKRLLREALLRRIIPHPSAFCEGLPPKGWSLVTIEDICSLITYGFTNPMPTTQRGVYMVTAKDIRDGMIDKSTARFTSIQAYESLLTDKSRPKQGDVLVTKDGTLGRTAVVAEEIICINQSVALLRPSDANNTHFLQLVLSSPQYQETMLEESGGSAVKHIYITTLAKMPIAMPTSAEMRDKVVRLFDALIKTIDLIAKKRERLDYLKKALASDLLSGRKRVTL